MERQEKRTPTLKAWLPYLLVAPSLIVVCLFVLYPIFNSVIRSFQERGTGAFTLENYAYFFTNPNQQWNIFYTMNIVLATVALSITISYLLALYIRFSQSKISQWLAALNLIPRFIPGMVASYAMIIVIQDAGVISRITELLGYRVNLGWMYNYRAIILMNLWFNIPFSTLIILAALSGIQDSIIEGAKDVGASRWQIFKNMILPLSYKDALIAVTFVFMGNVGSFSTPYLMDGNAPQMLGRVLYNQFNYPHYERSAALSVIIFLVCSVAASFYIYTNMKEKEWEKKG
jgi:ABC-type spermidine/putrescine transport system permease subunit I